MADNLTTFMCWLYWNMGASTSWNPQGRCRPVQGLVYLYLYLSIFISSLTLCSTSFLTRSVQLTSILLQHNTFQNFPDFSDVLSEVSNFQHLRKLCSDCITLLASSLDVSPIHWWKKSVECCFFHCNPEFDVTCTYCVICYHATHAVEMFHIIHFVFGLSSSVLGSVALRCQLQRFFDTHFPTTDFLTADNLCAVLCASS